MWTMAIEIIIENFLISSLPWVNFLSRAHLYPCGSNLIYFAIVVFDYLKRDAERLGIADRYLKFIEGTPFLR